MSAGEEQILKDVEKMMELLAQSKYEGPYAICIDGVWVRIAEDGKVEPPEAVGLLRQAFEAKL